jgi:hypothetical protein
VPVTAQGAVPGQGSLVEVRGQRWVVSDSSPGGDGSTLLVLQSVEDGRYGESLPVIWEIEPGRRALPTGSLPEVTAGGFDPPERLAAFLDAVRWSAVTSADVRTLQAPLRSGVVTEEYQLEPVARAIEAPRVNLLLADDVGLGKTIEAGLAALELLLRHRAKRVMIVCPPGLMVKWQDEMADKFGLDFVIVDSAQLNTLRRSHGSAANPFRVYPLTIVSLSWLRGAKRSGCFPDDQVVQDAWTTRNTAKDAGIDAHASPNLLPPRVRDRPSIRPPHPAPERHGLAIKKRHGLLRSADHACCGAQASPRPRGHHPVRIRNHR